MRSAKGATEVCRIALIWSDGRARWWRARWRQTVTRARQRESALRHKDSWGNERDTGAVADKSDGKVEAWRCDMRQRRKSWQWWTADWEVAGWTRRNEAERSDNETWNLDWSDQWCIRWLYYGHACLYVLKEHEAYLRYVPHRVRWSMRVPGTMLHWILSKQWVGLCCTMAAHV